MIFGQMSQEKPNLGKPMQQWGFYFIMQQWNLSTFMDAQMEIQTTRESGRDIPWETLALVLPTLVFLHVCISALTRSYTHIPALKFLHWE